MARRHRKNNDEESEINITPMMDIVFILLIFFIVTASFVKEAGIDVTKPNAQTAEQKERANILIAIDKHQPGLGEPPTHRRAGGHRQRPASAGREPAELGGDPGGREERERHLRQGDGLHEARRAWTTSPSRQGR